MTRSDGRAPARMRPTKMTPGFLGHAEGSVLIEVGRTRVVCSASVEDRVPPFLRNSGKGWVTAEYGMLPRATSTRTQREATAGKVGGRTQEIQRLIGRSLRSVTKLTELGVHEIWAKAISAKHGKILTKVGAHHVVYPESAMGDRVAHLITGRMLDYIEFDDGFAIAKIHAPPATHGRALSESGVRERYGVTVVGVKRAHEDFQHATPETRILAGDLLIVSGPTPRVEKFAGQAK